MSSVKECRHLLDKCSNAVLNRILYADCLWLRGYLRRYTVSSQYSIIFFCLFFHFDLQFDKFQFPTASQFEVNIVLLIFKDLYFRYGRSYFVMPPLAAEQSVLPTEEGYAFCIPRPGHTNVLDNGSYCSLLNPQIAHALHTMRGCLLYKFVANNVLIILKYVKLDHFRNSEHQRLHNYGFCHNNIDQ